MDIQLTEKPIVKYDRRFSNYFKATYSLSKIDADLFNTVLSIVRERKEVSTTILASEIIDRSRYLEKKNKDFSIAKLIACIDTMTDHVGGMYYLVHEEETGMDIKMYLFDSFGINQKTGDLSVILGKSFSKYFFDIEKQRPFTRYYLSNFLGLKSKYTKTLYRLFLDHYGGFTIELTELFELLGLENSSTQRSFINRLPIYIKQIEGTGDFLLPIEFTVNKVPGKRRANRSVTFSYRENPTRITEKVIEKSDIQECNDEESLICPYCGDEIIATVNQITGKKFWCHKNWKDHRKCELKNAENLDDMLKAIESGRKKMAEREKKKAALANNPIAIENRKSAANAKDFREQLREELASEQAESNHMKQTTLDSNDPDAPFPVG